MKNFVKLFYDLEQTNQQQEKINLICNYLHQVDDEEKIWMLALFTGRRPRRMATTLLQKKWALERCELPEWLFDECYAAVGDMAETISLLLPATEKSEEHSLSFWIKYILALEEKDEDERKLAVLNAWDKLSNQERFIFNKIVSATLKIDTPQNLLVKALAHYTGLNSAGIMHKLMSKWTPDGITFVNLLQVNSNTVQEVSAPYPFLLAQNLDSGFEQMQEPADWLIEWKWDGLRVQIIKREGKLFIWNRAEELLNDKFPEFLFLEEALPDGTVIDGEILAYKNGKILPYHLLQSRISKKHVNAKALAEVPAVFFAFDILELDAKDIRELTLSERRKMLAELLDKLSLKNIQLSGSIEVSSWEELANLRNASRSYAAEGFMLKRKDSIYESGRQHGNWLKWKIDPLCIDAVLIYAQTGSGSRSNLFTEYTFGLWEEGKLISITKASGGISDREQLAIDKWVRQNTIEKFGPVRTVKPGLVFELGFEGIQESTRHKSGMALRFPVILKWRLDKKIEEADTLASLRKILESFKP